MRSDKKPPTPASAVPEEWVQVVRGIIDRDGHAVRGCPTTPIIEIKSLTTNRWHPLGLPGGGAEFTNYGERNVILHKLVDG